MDKYIECMAIILITMSSTVLAGCPSKCICLENVVKCSGRSLINVPNFERLDMDPQVIDLSSNEIDFIAYNDLSFDKAVDVQILYLNNSKIIDVDDKAFNELIEVEEIYLSKNLLGELPPSSFQYNNKLVLLDLSYNLFRVMPKLISKSLETLLLQNSGIERVENDRFMHIPNLKYLNLQRNHIRMIDIEIFKYIPKIRFVQLEFNRWKCTCQSVQLFNFLQENDVLNIKEPIQCKNNDNLFVNFFSENGTFEPVKELCKENDLLYNFVGNYIEPKQKEIFNQRRSAKGLRVAKKEEQQTNKLQKLTKLESYSINAEIIKEQNKTKTLKFSSAKCENDYEFIQTFTLTNYIIFFIAVILAFVVGLASGCIFSGSRNNQIKDSSNSYDSLLRRSSVV